MFTYTTKKNKTDWEFTVTIKAEDVTKKFDELLATELTTVSIEGFRKGKAPKDIAEKKVDRAKIYEAAVGQLLTKIYNEIVTKESIKPIVQPRVELVKAKEGEDFVIIIHVAERPDLKLGDYKTIVANVKKELKTEDIWVPGKETPKPEDEKTQEQRKVNLLNKIFEALSQKSTIEISDLIVQDEVNRKLASLLDEVKKLGMTIDQYVNSRNTTVEALRESYRKEIVDMYKIELVLEMIADDGKITVEKSDLDKILSAIEDPKAREEARANSYLYASILKRQKTLDYILGL